MHYRGFVFLRESEKVKMDSGPQMFRIVSARPLGLQSVIGKSFNIALFNLKI